ncbi:hypothetical protein CDL12_13606 [Handroanthus impetiginosus]|uniref:HTH myb-type domain-containing protein n=1 Tax=Handroanthus impetiginosus TaxID=429701 RepID=A0A2G9H8E1_9LAMI|nr:hypothetical protein CDL12_13606 [Handroanthus impetiginosus]
MALQNVHNKEMSLVLSSDAKPRLKWTPELHQRFVDAVHQLGGAEKATPKSLMRVMDISGLTLYHLKSHLQKYRLGRSQQSQTYHQNKQEDNGEQRNNLTNKNCDGGEKQINEGSQVAHALQMQMEVQRKLHEQIEVQRHLQLRIEAQGKYLQSVLRKAQETLSGCGSRSIDVERAKAQLSQLSSMVDSGCPSSSFSVLTESDGSMLKDGGNKLLGHNGYSLESSLTSSESSGCKEETQPKNEVDDSPKCGNGKTNKGKGNSVALSLMEMHPVENNESENRASKRKRSERTIDEVEHIEQSSSKRCRSMENIDLNCKSLNDFDSGPKVIDLNFTGFELFNETFSV